MALFGIDISNNNGPNLSIAEIKSEGFSWVEIKCSEGSYYQDPDFRDYRDQAIACGLSWVGYHYAIASCNPDSQAATFVANGGGDKVMIDFENNSGTVNDFWALVRAFNAAGVDVVASYIPEWYWAGAMGGGDLSQVPGLIASAYPGGSGPAIAIYDADGADTGHGWSGYGGGKPTIWQFTDHAQVDGTTVDANAFIGTNDQLIELLGGAVALSQDDINAVVNGVTSWLSQFIIGYVGPIGHDVKRVASQMGLAQDDAGYNAVPGFPEGGSRSLYDLAAAIAAHTGVPNTADTLPNGPTPPAAPAA